MKYKEFVNWCNERACDGWWGMDLTMLCIGVMQDIIKEFFWEKVKAWRKHELYEYICQHISQINIKIENNK